MINKVLNDLSCIIPSLGGANINLAISNILEGSYIPSEIIISIPNQKKISFQKYEKYKKKIKFKKIFSKKGQVNQRIKAIKYSTKKYIIQLDDDINLKKNCIENLYKAIKENNSEKKVFGPQIIDIRDRKMKITKHFCGKISEGGVAYPLKKCCINYKYNKVEWLPGGCVMSLRKNMITNNYFPYEGKAYFEDLFNSMERQKRNISHYVVKNSIVFLKNNHNNTLSILELKKYLFIKYIFVEKYFGISLSFWLSSLKIFISNFVKSIFLIKS